MRVRLIWVLVRFDGPGHLSSKRVPEKGGVRDEYIVIVKRGSKHPSLGYMVLTAQRWAGPE